MYKEPAGTKLALIKSAGELFAEYGLEGTSIRAIADKAGANSAAISYYFGSKENLYTETLRYVVNHDKPPRVREYLEGDERLESAEGIAEIIAEIVQRKFAAFYSHKQPRWHGRLIMRSLLDPSPSLIAIVEQFFLPDHIDMKKLLKRARPDLTEQRAQLMAFSMMGQIAFYEFARAPVLYLLDRKEYEEGFLEAAARHTALMMITALDLPVPASCAVATAYTPPKSTESNSTGK